MTDRQGSARERAVFLDKDGTLVVDVPYNVDPRLMRLTPGAGETLLKLHEAGFQLWVVTNQSGIGRGLFPESALGAVKDELIRLLAGYGVSLHGFLYCPHAPEGEGGPNCACRKPAPGLILAAAKDAGIDLRRSWLVGDIASDVEAGNRAGCRSIIIGPEAGRDWESVAPDQRPYAACSDLADAAEVILTAAARDRDATAPGRRRA